MFVIRHVKTVEGVDKMMYFKRFGKFQVDWVEDPKDAKQYKEERQTAKDISTLRMASKGDYYTVQL